MSNFCSYIHDFVDFLVNNCLNYIICGKIAKIAKLLLI